MKLIEHINILIYTKMTERTYTHGRIYKLYSHINEYYYIGSTHNTLRHRKLGHISNPLSKKVSDWFDDIGTDNLQIMELKHYDNITRTQLKIYEDEEVKKHLGQEQCVNCNRVYTGMTKKEYQKEYRENNKEKLIEYKKQYYEENKEKISIKSRKYREENIDMIKHMKHEYYCSHKKEKKEYDKQYRLDNKNRIKERFRQKVLCVCCNEIITKGALNPHMKSMKHIKNFIEY